MIYTYVRRFIRHKLKCSRVHNTFLKLNDILKSEIKIRKLVKKLLQKDSCIKGGFKKS